MQLATLLHTGGQILQDIYYCNYDAQGTQNKKDKMYDDAIKHFDEYFKTKYNILYERHLFRKIQQQHGEEFNKFILRLQNQARQCKFSDENEHIIDQILETCKMEELRKQMFIMSNADINLNKIIEIGNTSTLEAVNRHLSGKKKTKEFNTLKVGKKKVYTMWQ